MMRKIYSLLIAVVLISVVGNGQAPGIFNYQGVVRNSQGAAIQNKTITLRLTIHDLTSTGAIVYQETRTTATNPFGLFSVQVGSAGATSVIGVIAGVNWSTGNKFIQVEIDVNGGTSFISIGSARLASVPYALFAGSAAPSGTAGGDLIGVYPNPNVARIRGVNVSTTAPATSQVLQYDGANWSPSNTPWLFNGASAFYNNTGNIGIGTNTPAQKLDVNGTIRTNGIIMLTGAAANSVMVSGKRWLHSVE